MSDTKQKVRVKAEVDVPSVKAKLAKSPKASDAAAIKKGVKKEPESPVGKKKDSETPAKAIKKEAEVIQKEAEVINKTVKKELHAEASKTKKGEVTGKVKVVKKEEVLVSSGKTASPKDPLKKKKASTEEPEKKKKVYSLPGQKHDPPDERDPLRIFYESLYEQNSKSEMAEVWMMEHGLLEPDAAKKAFERKKKNQVSQKLGSPVKQSRDVSVNCEKKLSTNTTAKSEKKSSTVKSEKKSSTVNGDSKSSKAKRIRDSDEDEDDDFILKPKKKSKSSA